MQDYFGLRLPFDYHGCSDALSSSRTQGAGNSRCCLNSSIVESRSRHHRNRSTASAFDPRYYLRECQNYESWRCPFKVSAYSESWVSNMHAVQYNRELDDAGDTIYTKKLAILWFVQNTMKEKAVTSHGRNCHHSKKYRLLLMQSSFTQKWPFTVVGYNHYSHPCLGLQCFFQILLSVYTLYRIFFTPRFSTCL